MTCLEKQHLSHKASMQHPSNLDTYMDETDREVMNLTDRAFKSLCVGDEAIYNDSELFLSPVDCHKPLAEEIPKKPRENSALDVKKHGTHRPNGVYSTPWQMTKSTLKVPSLFAAFAAKKNSDVKITNGDSWDKSALLSIQTELSEFSSDYQKHLMDEHIYHVKNHYKPSGKETGNKPIQKSKNQQSKSTKLRKLNSKNFFLHSEFSPFQSWGDFNRFGLQNVEMFPCNTPGGLYNSPLYRELNHSNRLHEPEPNKRQTSQSTSPLEPQHKSKSGFSQRMAQAKKTGPLVPEKPSDLKFPKLPDIQFETLQPQVLPTSSGSFQRCQSEGDLYAPWRKSRSRVKGVLQPFASSPGCERSNTGEEGAKQNKKEVRMVEEATCLNSTPFSISQLLTPVIPSRQDTGTSEILQSVHSPTALDIAALHEPEIRPSPDIKREGYRSKASGLLFNLKDNRKRVKATYSPPKFKALDAEDQNKLSPLIEQELTKHVLESPGITDFKSTTTVQKTDVYPVSPEAADLQSSQSSSHINSTLPDDFLGLSLLQAGNRGSPIKSSKSKKNPSAKATYPSLNMYRKSSPGELNPKTPVMDVAGSHSAVNKSAKQKSSKERLPDKDSKELQGKRHLTNPEMNNANHEYTHLNHLETTDEVLTEKTDAVTVKEKYLPAVLPKRNMQQDALTLPGSENPDKSNTGGVFKAQDTPNKYTKCHKKESKPKHLFSARQNNYIKNQRHANLDDNDDVVDEGECECWQEIVISGGRDEPGKRDLNVDVHKDKGKVQENTDDPLITESFTKDVFAKNNYSLASKNDLGICTEQGGNKNDASSMKGNTSAKIALFTLKEQPSNVVPGSKKKHIVKDRYELATVALEKRIAERERIKKQGDRQHGQGLPMKGDHDQERTLALSQKETSGSVTPDMGGQKAISGFTPTSQNVRSMSDIDTNHGECHVPEVRLAEPCKQEGAAKHSPSILIYTDRDSSDRHIQQGGTRNIKSMPSVTELKELVSMPKNIRLDQESSVGQDYIDTKLRDGADESCSQRKKGSSKPETHPRRGRPNFHSEDTAMSEGQRKEDVGSVERSEKQQECLSPVMKKANLPKNKGPVKGHVSSLMEKFNREQVVPSLNVQERLSQGDDLMGYPGNDLLTQKAVSPNDTVGLHKVEESKHNHKAREGDSDDTEIPEKDSKLVMVNEENLGGEIADSQGNQTANKDVTRIEEYKTYVTRTENESASDVLRRTDNQNKIQYHGESSVAGCSPDQFEKSDGPDEEPEKTPNLNLLNPHHDGVLNQAEPEDGKQLEEQGNLLSKLSEDSSYLLQKSKESPPLHKYEEIKHENLDTMDSCSKCDPESKPHNTDMAVHPPKDVDKGGWVRCLIDSARNLTPTCQSNASSPIPGKPALFKVKDNTFSASPVTKTVRPILHKTVAGVTQPWSPRESLSGSERGEEDPDLFKDFLDVQSPAQPSTPVRITHPNQSSTQVVPSSSSQSATDRERKGLMDCSTVPEEEEWRLTINALSDGTGSCETSAGDTVVEHAFGTAPTDSIQGSKVPSERSESACSGVENQLQGKPPAVPPKTEKALRRAMKLTTKRIQKAEAKSKSERGRSTEKGSCQKRERRHHSSDKVLIDSSYQRQHSTDRGGGNQSTEENSSETSLPNSHTGQRHTTHHNTPTSPEKRKPQHESPSSLIKMDGDAKSSGADKHKGNQHKGQPDTQNVNVDCERSGRTGEKYLPQKLSRRAHSLDRVSCGKPERSSLSSEDPVCKSNDETLKKLGTVQRAPLRQKSIEHPYGSPANTLVQAQSFPMTQRKLLQDLDSGQYFVVDMPVQVKTKTFFDPETGSYVQLPVQSLDGPVPRAQSVEVVNAPSLMLYHGFVPLPVSSLP